MDKNLTEFRSRHLGKSFKLNKILTRSNISSQQVVLSFSNIQYKEEVESWATQLYPDIPYSTVLFLSTISSLLMIPGSLAAGAVLGKKVSFKAMAVVSMGGIIIAVSGMNIGCFFTTFFISGVANVTGNANPRIPCQIGLVIVAVFAVIWSVAEIRRKRS